jgi:hypothetical protein
MPEDGVTNIDAETPSVAIALFGNAGSSIWPYFSLSAEYADGKADPLNRWSERMGNELAMSLNGLALFPFGGPPHQPFLQWAKKAEALASSQIGMLIHPQYGLWHAYRFAIALPVSAIEISDDRRLLAPPNHRHPCNDCSSQACLSACPVNAFTEGNYDVETCFRYLDATPDAICHQTGCQARTACPEGKSHLYQPTHAAFHMKKFVSALRQRYNK